MAAGDPDRHGARQRAAAALLGLLGGLDRYELLAFAVVAGLVVTGLEHGLAVVDDYVNTKLDQRMVLDFRSDLFRHAQRLSLAFHDTKQTGQLMYQINYQASARRRRSPSRIPPLLQSVLTLVGMFLIVFLIEPTLALLVAHGRAVHLLLGRLLRAPHRAAARARAQAWRASR